MKDQDQYQQHRLDLCARLSTALARQDECGKAMSAADEEVASARAELDANLRGFGAKK